MLTLSEQSVLADFTSKLRERINTTRRHQPIAESTLFVEAADLLLAELNADSIELPQAIALLRNTVQFPPAIPNTVTDIMAMAIDTVAAENGFTRK